MPNVSWYFLTFYCTLLKLMVSRGILKIPRTHVEAVVLKTQFLPQQQWILLIFAYA